MFIDFDFYGYEDGAIYDTTNVVNKITRVELKNSIIDEIHILENTDFVCSPTKGDWQLMTLLKAPFHNDLEGGNIQFSEQIIRYIQIQKRKIEDFNYLNLATFDFDPFQTIYQVEDYFIQADQEYEYTVIPLLADYTEGERVTERFTADFDGTWLFDANKNYRLLYNLDYGSIDHYSPSAVYEPLGSKYPVVTYNADISYKRGSITGLIVADASSDGKISVDEERKLRIALIDFLTNKKPKIIKDAGGNYVLISIIGNPQLAPLNNLNQKLYDLSFEWIEIGDVHDESTLVQTGLKEAL